MARYDFVSSEELFRLAKINKGGWWGLWNVDSQMEVVAPVWAREPKFTKDHIIFQTEEGMGVIGHGGKIIIPPKFYDIIPQTNDRLIVKTPLSLYGLFDGSGKELLPFTYEAINYETDKCIIVKPQGGLYGIVDVKGNTKLPYVYEKLSYYWPDKIIIAKRRGKYGVITSSLKELIPFEFDDINVYSKFIIVKQGKYKGLYDYNGKELLPPTKYYYINPVNKNLYIVAKGNKEGIILSDGTVVVDCIYENILDIGDGYFSVSNMLRNEKGKFERKWGLISSDGTLVVPCKYDAIHGFAGNVAIVRQSGKFGCINKLGKLVINPEWDNIIYEEGYKYIKVGKSSKWGLYDLDGSQVIPVIYDSVFVADDGIDVFYNGKEGVVIL